MTSVFISHVGEDKPLITPVLDALLQLQFNLWIDNPDAVGSAWYERHRPAIRRIEPGRNWRLSIQEALDAVDAVLVFWSQRAVIGSHEMFLFEVDYSRLKAKCIQVKIDDVRGALIPAVFRHDQIFDLSTFKDYPGSHGGFQDVVQALRKVGSRTPSLQSNVVLIDASLDRHSSDYVQDGSRIHRPRKEEE